MVTPPVCVPVFIAAGIAKAPMMRSGWSATWLGMAAYLVPFLFAYMPGLILRDSPLNMVMDFVLSVAGLLLLSAGMQGYFRSKLNWPVRVLFVIFAAVPIFLGIRFFT